MKIRLSVLLPLILVVASGVSAVLIHIEDDSNNRIFIEEQAIKQVRLQMTQLQNILYNRMTQGNEEEALLNLSLVAMNTGVRTLLLADQNSRVLLSNRYLTKGDPATAASGYSQSEALQAVNSGLAKLAFSQTDPNLLHGYFPLIVNYKGGGLEKEFGVLYVEQDFTERFEFAHRMAVESSLVFGGILMLSALLLAFIIHQLVGKRVNVLAEASTRLAEGDYSVQTGLRGTDELAELGRTFDVMVRRLDNYGKEREQSLLDQKRVLETAVDGYWQVDGEGRLIDVNDAYCRMSGYSREELLQMRIPDLEAKEETPEQVHAHMKLIFEKGYDRFETKHRHKDGRIIDVEVATSYWKDRHEFFVFVRDIGEHKQAEAKIIDARNQLAATLDAIPDLLFELDLDGTYLDVHVQETELLAAPADSLCGKTVNEVLPPEAAGIVMAALMDADRNGISRGQEFELTLPQGSAWFELSVSKKNVTSGMQHFIVLSRDITARKNIESALQDSRDQYRRVITNLPAGVFQFHSTASGELSFKFVSERFCAIIGKKAEDIYADHTVAFSAAHPDDLPGLLVDIQESVKTHGEFMWEGRVLTDGNTKWLQIETMPEPEPDGGCVWDGFLIDITDRKLAQLEAQHNQELLNAAERMGHLGSWELDLVSNILSWSEEIYRIFELDPEEFHPSYESFLNAIHPDDRDQVKLAYTQSLENRQSYDIVHRLLMADGRVKWVREFCNSDFDESGKPLRSVGAVQDITEQKQGEDWLRVASVAFETHEAIMITDASANIIRINRAFSDLTGYTMEEVVGRNPRMLSSGRQDNDFYREMWKEILDTGTWSGELWDRRKDGSEYPKWLTITAVKNESGVTTGYVGIFTDMSARKKAEEDILNLAFFDTLTHLPNRRLLSDRFEIALSASARSGHYGAVLFLDLDRFKTINDTQGHNYGDLLLVEVAERLKSCVREADTVARLGGDEYVILLDSFSIDVTEASQRVAHIAEKIRAALGVPCSFNGRECHTSASIGVCLYQGNTESVDTLLKHADLAMYQAKEAGRNTVRFFDPKMQHAVETRAALEVDLRHAVPGNQLQLHYQIQVDHNNRPLGAEALVRWLHPERGMVSPGEFIPVAEESALILEIGHWVMETACRQLEKWNANEATRAMILAVNVSGQQFRQIDFVDSVAALVDSYRIDPSRLKLELTESVVLSDVAEVVRKMHELKAIGVRLSLDDFGTGYSSLSYLKRLPLDQIKIDQSFVRDITTDPNDAVMVQTIIALAQNFRLSVIAEGVETTEQLDFLKVNGCLAYQGYLFSKPVPIMELDKFLGELQGF